jgi:hypothetical protein
VDNYTGLFGLCVLVFMLNTVKGVARSGGQHDRLERLYLLTVGFHGVHAPYLAQHVHSDHLFSCLKSKQVD